MTLITVRAIRSVVLAVLLFIASASSATVATPVSVPQMTALEGVVGCVNHNPVTAAHVSPEQLEWLQFVAQNSNTSLTDVVRREGAVDAFNHAQDEFRRAHPRAFAGSVIGDDGCYYLYLTDTADSAARALAQDMSRLPGVVVVADRRASAVEGQTWVKVIAEAMTKNLGERPQMVYLDQRTGHIRVEVAAGQLDAAVGVIDGLTVVDPVLVDVVEVPRYQGVGASTIMGGGS